MTQAYVSLCLQPPAKTDAFLDTLHVQNGVKKTKDKAVSDGGADNLVVTNL